MKGENTVIGVASWVPDGRCNAHGFTPSIFARITKLDNAATLNLLQVELEKPP